MTAHRRILIVNPNISERVTQILATEARRIVGDAAEIVAVTAPFGAASLECRAELAIAAHAVLEAIAAARDYDSVVIGAFGDPGLEAAQEIAQAPVFGLGRSGLRAAAADGRRFAIVTIGARMRGEIERMATACGLADRFVAIRFLRGGVLDVAADRAAFTDALIVAANACAIENGAECVLFGGAPFAGLAHELAGRVAVPLVDGLASALRDAMAAPRHRLESAPAGAPLRKPTARVSEALAGRIGEFLARGG